ncbi:MAG TPA: ATP-binding cassette domain-containing protein [Acidimicrobiia bacterium]
MIEARGLTKRYESTVAVDDLSFDVRPGHVTGFLGPNGAGKTTTMRLILGLDRPNKGTVAVNGRSYADHRFPLHEVGALLDAHALHGGRRAYDHLLCLAQSNRIPRRRVGEVLDAVGLTDVAGRRAGTFSLGMGQRLGIAAALLGDPGILIFDEPVNGLDPEGILWIRTLLKSLASEGRTIFISSHLMSEMSLTADRLIVIGRGRLIADAPIGELTGRATGQVRVRSPRRDELVALLERHGATVERTEPDALVVRGATAATIGDLAAEQQLALHELTPELASLEETFFELTNDSVDFRAEVPGPAASSATGA